MVDILDKLLLGGDEYLLSVGALYDEQGVDGAFVHINQFAQVTMRGVVSSKSDEVLPAEFALLSLLGRRFWELHHLVGKHGSLL